MSEKTKKIEFPSDIYSPLDFKSFLESEEIKKTGAFSDLQLQVLLEFCDMIDFSLNTWHNKDDLENSHKDLRDKVDNIDAKLRNHRHDVTKQYSTKPEF
jgi:hypothetical protein